MTVSLFLFFLLGEGGCFPFPATVNKAVKTYLKDVLFRLSQSVSIGVDGTHGKSNTGVPKWLLGKDAQTRQGKWG